MPAGTAQGRRQRVRRLHHLDPARRHRSRVQPQGARRMMHRLAIDVQPGEYAVARLAADAPTPAGLIDHEPNVLISVTRTPGELSIICPAGLVPEGTTA